MTISCWCAGRCPLPSGQARATGFSLTLRRMQPSRPSAPARRSPRNHDSTKIPAADPSWRGQIARSMLKGSCRSPVERRRRKNRPKRPIVRIEEGHAMVDEALLRLAAKLACVALVVSVVFPVGSMVLPYVADEMGHLSFSAIEAVLSTSLGFAIYGLFFG